MNASRNAHAGAEARAEVSVREGWFGEGGECRLGELFARWDIYNESLQLLKERIYGGFR